ncbi:rhomboid family intramembrane serine protease [uncultured Shimia sp.]|uniref:rhomboid family intramembrane serine protease n=1 Tax=uncultured Shimia sp. TaxID=573152 RepID=UPI00260FE677|nr:rhomboid family intramembrane serine protease [uncultured Shimia sp.]
MSGESGSGDDVAPPQARLWRAPAVLGLVMICCAIELTLMAADAGLVGTRLWRGIVYQNGAFWAGLLDNWRPNFPLQPLSMFVTYAFLHGGFWHLAGNMVALAFLSDIALQRVGQGAFAMIYGVSALGGAIVFGLLTQSASPMVGASGALFGLAGAWQFWRWCDLCDEGLSRLPVWRTTGGLVVLNFMMWWLMEGALAWETHLGGFIFGWGVAYFVNLCNHMKKFN